MDYGEKAKMPTLSHAFQPFLRLLDDYAIKILSDHLMPKIPNKEKERHNYFNPYLNDLSPKERFQLEKNQRYLHHNLVFGRSIQKLGTLLFCLDFAQKGRKKVSGIWKSVRDEFSGDEMKNLYHELSAVNTFRNTHIAHVETPLNDPDDAWEAMILFIKCVNRMASLVKNS